MRGIILSTGGHDPFTLRQSLELYVLCARQAQGAKWVWELVSHLLAPSEWAPWHSDPPLPSLSFSVC